MGDAGFKGDEGLMKKLWVVLLLLTVAYPCYAIIAGFGGSGGGGGAAVVEPTVEAYWKFESSLADEEAALTLTGYNMAYDTGSPITGSGSASFDDTTPRYSYILYGDLPAGFPMTGTSYRTVSMCAYFNFNSAQAGDASNLISKYNTDLKRTVLIRKNADDKMEVLHGPAGGGTPASTGTHGTALSHSTNYAMCYTEDGVTADWTLDVYNLSTSAAVGSQAYGTWGNVLNVEDTHFFISGRDPSGTDPWYGLVDEVKIYGVVLDSDQIEAYFAGDFID